MEQKIPEWLTIDFLNECLHSVEKYKNTTVTSFHVSPAVPPGNNFGSCISRVKLTYKNNTNGDVGSTSVIVKSDDGPLKELFDDIEQCEHLFYNKYLPIANALVNTPFAPSSFLSPIPSVIVMEDLKDQGFLMADRAKQLDFEHCKLYATAAANFHAVSFAVYKNNPELVQSMSDEKVFTNDKTHSKLMRNAVTYALECLAKHAATLDGYKKHVEVIKNCSYTLWDMCVEAHKPSEVLNCLNQGDPWTTNMMFKYDHSGKVTDINLLDFQCLRFGSPVNDIVFFAWSSANHEVRKNKLDELYKLYLDALNNSLQRLDSHETLSYDLFVDNIKKLSPLALWLAAFPTFISPSPPDLNALFSKVGEEYTENCENPLEKYYTESYVQNSLPQILDDLEHAGVFDYLSNKLDCSK